MVTKILFVAANPLLQGSTQFDREFNIIQGCLESNMREPHDFQLIPKLATRITDLQSALIRYEPQILHFSGHGDGDSGLVLVDDKDQATLISTDTLTKFFRLCPGLECVLMNACYSSIQARAIAEFVPAVIGNPHAILNTHAIEYSSGFYKALSVGRSIPQAHEWGTASIQENDTVQPYTISYRDISSIPEADAPTFQTPVLILNEEKKTLILSILGTPYFYQAPYGKDKILVGRQRRKPGMPEDMGNDLVVRLPQKDLEDESQILNSSSRQKNTLKGFLFSWLGKRGPETEDKLVKEGGTPGDSKNLKISRQHLLIKYKDDDYYLTSTGLNGTQLNGKDIVQGECHRLRSKDKITLAGILNLEVLVRPFFKGFITNKSIIVNHVNQQSGTSNLLLETSVGDMMTMKDF